MENIELLRSIGFSDKFLNKLAEFDNSVVDVQFSSFSSEDFSNRICDSNSLIYENGNKELSSNLSIDSK